MLIESVSVRGVGAREVGAQRTSPCDAGEACVGLCASMVHMATVRMRLSKAHRLSGKTHEVVVSSTSAVHWEEGDSGGGLWTRGPHPNPVRMYLADSGHASLFVDVGKGAFKHKEV